MEQRNGILEGVLFSGTKTFGVGQGEACGAARDDGHRRERRLDVASDRRRRGRRVEAPKVQGRLLLQFGVGVSAGAVRRRRRRRLALDRATLDVPIVGTVVVCTVIGPISLTKLAQKQLMAENHLHDSVAVN